MAPPQPESTPPKLSHLTLALALLLHPLLATSLALPDQNPTTTITTFTTTYNPICQTGNPSDPAATGPCPVPENCYFKNPEGGEIICQRSVPEPKLPLNKGNVEEKEPKKQETKLVTKRGQGQGQEEGCTTSSSVPGPGSVPGTVSACVSTSESLLVPTRLTKTTTRTTTTTSTLTVMRTPTRFIGDVGSSSSGASQQPPVSTDVDLMTPTRFLTMETTIVPSTTRVATDITASSVTSVATTSAAITSGTTGGGGGGDGLNSITSYSGASGRVGVVGMGLGLGLCLGWLGVWVL
ncbi:hypothetical protein FQN50_002814 [Emmonsiellopsis sp. PD_5]|nr:hypothetical protein FQN50_002814 [Emmonsiellopsis sp. PD_5]